MNFKLNQQKHKAIVARAPDPLLKDTHLNPAAIFLDTHLNQAARKLEICGVNQVKLKWTFKGHPTKKMGAG